MSFILKNNGQFIALVLAAACASFIAYTVIGFEGEEPVSVRTLVLAGLSAVAATWVFWWILVARGKRLLALRGGFAGALAGIFAHPLFIFAGSLAQAIDDCPEIACIYGSVLTMESLKLLALGSAFVTTFGLLFVGPLTMFVGALGGILAVVISGFGRPAKRAENAETDNDNSVPDHRIDNAVNRGMPVED